MLLQPASWLRVEAAPSPSQISSQRLEGRLPPSGLHTFVRSGPGTPTSRAFPVPYGLPGGCKSVSALSMAGCSRLVRSSKPLSRPSAVFQASYAPWPTTSGFLASCTLPGALPPMPERISHRSNNSISHILVSRLANLGDPHPEPRARLRDTRFPALSRSNR